MTGTLKKKKLKIWHCSQAISPINCLSSKEIGSQKIVLCLPSVLFQVSRWAILVGLLQSGTCPDPFDSSHFPSSIRMSVSWTRACLYRRDGYSGAAARQRSNEELSGGPDGEQLAGVGWKARSTERWCSSDLLHLLKSKLSQKVFISRQTRLWPDSCTGLDLLI